ncbi:MAG: hypothetical protein JNG89_04490 [Planctomycetaceae bacterium]|nr:hypothetical protein [Planctomycetaceae bacterium]
MIPRKLGERIRFHSFRASFFGGGLVGGLAILMHFRHGAVPEGMLAMGVIAGAIAGSFLYFVDRARDEKQKSQPGESTGARQSTHDESDSEHDDRAAPASGGV